MRKILALLTLLFLTGNLSAQDGQFRVDYNHVAIYLSSDVEWSQWFEAQNTFVINANDNNDIIHYMGNGNVVTYRNLGGLEVNYTESGEKYQILNILGEEGDPIRFQLFDNPKIGAKLITSDGMIQFSRF
jgi:hypothetical protein